VTVAIPLWVQRVTATTSIISMAVLLVLLARDRTTITLFAFWSVIGAVLYAVARPRTPEA
jgi:hypothetical protein